MSSRNHSPTPTISSLKELEGEVIGWTLFAGRPQELCREGANTIQLPRICQVLHGKLETIFDTESWIGDSGDPEWHRAEEYLLEQNFRHIWSPVRIRLGSILLRPGELPESDDEGEIYRYQGIEDARGGSHPENEFRRILVRKFIEQPK